MLERIPHIFLVLVPSNRLKSDPCWVELELRRDFLLLPDRIHSPFRLLPSPSRLHPRFDPVHNFTRLDIGPDFSQLFLLLKEFMIVSVQVGAAIEGWSTLLWGAVPSNSAAMMRGLGSRYWRWEIVLTNHDRFGFFSKNIRHLW